MFVIPRWSGSYSNDIVTDDNLHSNVAHDLEILHNLKNKNAREIKHRIYIDKEKTLTTIKYLHNRSITSEKLFIEVIFKTKKEIICRRNFSI
jgi:hypothetical protein